MPAYGRQVVALLTTRRAGGDAGTANDVDAGRPERLRGWSGDTALDNALLGCAIAFTPLMVALTFGEPMRFPRGAVPRRRLPWQLDVVLDFARQDPRRVAVLQGLFTHVAAARSAARWTRPHS
jgi:hypothetical protein